MAQQYMNNEPQIDANAAYATSAIDEIDSKLCFSPSGQRELVVNLSPAILIERSTTSESTNDENNDDNDDESSKFEEDQWYELMDQTGKKFCIRKQSRSNSQTHNVIEIHKLKEIFGNDKNTDFVWFHATSWESAIKIVKNGPRISRGPSDLAYYGAFYLNPNYDDCYEWFSTKASKFKGKYAMLIYNFEPQALSKNGKEVFDKQEWRKLTRQISQESSKVKYDWIYTYQNANPERINKSGGEARIRQTSNNQDATQLIIYTETMCRKIHQHLMGCIYYENYNSSTKN